MADEGPMYESDDQKYGALLSNLLNPPGDGSGDKGAQLAAANAPQRVQTPAQPTSGAMPQAPASNAAQAIRAGAQAAGQAIQTPPPAQPKPAVTPNAVTPSGNGPAAGTPQKSWADYVRQSNDSSMQSMGQAQTAASALQNEPSATAQNAPLEKRRQALAAPIPYRDQQTGKVLTSAVDPETGQTINPSQLYKPGTGTKILRALFPGKMGNQPISAPNSNYQAAQALRTQQAASIGQQEQQNITNTKADSDRLKDIGTEQRAVATGYGNVAKDSTAQQNAENKDDLAQVRAQLADQAGVPKTYEQAVIASNDPTLSPAQRQQYATSAKQIQQAEVKKFQYAARAAGGDPDERRQPMIDSATSAIQELNDKWYYNAAAGRFYDSTKNPDIDPNDATVTADQIKGAVTPSEFTDMKNKISTKLDADLTRAKLPRLGVRFDVKKTTPGGAQPTAQPAAQPAPAQTAPKSAAETQVGQVYNGYKLIAPDKTKQASWQKVGQ